MRRLTMAKQRLLLVAYTRECSETVGEGVDDYILQFKTLHSMEFASPCRTLGHIAQELHHSHSSTPRGTRFRKSCKVPEVAHKAQTTLPAYKILGKSFSTTRQICDMGAGH